MLTTAKKRINISVSKLLERAVERLASRDEMPVASKAAELLSLAIDLEEDQVWDSIASKRDTKDAKYVSHEKAWA